MKHYRSVRIGLAAALAGWAAAPSTVSAQGVEPDAVPYDGPIIHRTPVRWARRFAGGGVGPWISADATEGVPVTGRGFDTLEPLLPDSANPCAYPIDIPPSLVNGTNQGGIAPHCAVGADIDPMACPAGATRYVFFALCTAATGSVAHPMNPPANAVGKDVRELDVMFTERLAAGGVDFNAQTVGNTIITVIWHGPSAMNSAASCAGLTQPVLGAFVDGIILDFGPAVGGMTAPVPPCVPPTVIPGFFLGSATLDVLDPPLLIPPPGGSYEILFWNDAMATIVSGNNSPGGWGAKDPLLQGTSGPVRFRNNDYSAVPDDTGGQYLSDDPNPDECFVAGAACPAPIVAAVRLGYMDDVTPTSEVNRSVANVQIVSTTCGFYDVSVDASVEVTNSGTGTLNAASDYTLLINNVPAGSAIVRTIDIPLDSACLDNVVPNCTRECLDAIWDGTNQAGVCIEDGAGAGQPCTCSYTRTKTFVGVPLLPGDNVSVVVSPGLGSDPDSDASDDTASTTVPPVTPVLANVVSANPPLANLLLTGSYLDPLQTGNTLATTQGIGGATTPAEGPVVYSSITYNLDVAPCPPSTGVTITCSGTNINPCPGVASFTGSGTGPYVVTLTGIIPAGQCTAIKPAGTNVGQGIHYRYLPADMNLNGTTAANDILVFVGNINSGTCATANTATLPRCDVNRSGSISGSDLLRAVGLQNGVNTKQSWLTQTVPQASCPPL